MPRLLSSVFAVALACVTLAAVEAASGITYGRYDCGPYRQQFKVVTCSALICQLYTYDPGARGGGFSSTMDVASLHTLLASGAPGNRPCHLTGAGSTSMAMQPKPPAPRKAANVAPGRYECYTMSSGRLYAAMSENFAILGNGAYRDVAGHHGTYAFNAGRITFHGGALNGQRAVYKAGVAPLSNDPNNVTFLRSNGELGDSCDGVAR